MKILFLLFIGIALSATYSATNAAPENTEIDESVLEVKNIVAENFSEVKVSAKAYGVFDVETGELLASYNADESLPIASVTKLFTAEAVLEQSDDQLIVTGEDVATEGRSGKLEAGQEYKAHELLFPLLLESSNDAATALGRTLEEIPKNFTDAAGLSSKNQASVSELASEVSSLYIRMPRIFDITKLKQYIGEYTGWVNNSPVQDMEGYKGGKHGYTNEAGKTLVAIFSEAKLEGRELGYILLGSDDVKADTVELRAAVNRSVHFESDSETVLE